MKTVTKIILGLLILVCFAVWAEVTRSPGINNVSMYFFDVGQGDAILIEKGNYQILIDGGPDDKVLFELGKVMPPSDKKIESVILTHPHADHLTGINQVLDRYEVGTLYSSGVTHTTDGYLEFLNKLKEKNVEVKVPKVNEEIVPFENSDLTFLWPGEQYKEQNIDNLNNSSEVVQFCYFLQCAFLAGDIESDAQNEMLANIGEQDILSEILKMPHHGSINGLNQALLDTVKPKYAVISVGKDNSFGHPADVVLQALKENNIETFRTDQMGTIIFSFNEAGMVRK